MSEQEFRAMCQRQLQKMSDQAIRFQLTRSVGGWEREEIEREAANRLLTSARLDYHTQKANTYKTGS
jgi:hypothetical protein